MMSSVRPAALPESWRCPPWLQETVPDSTPFLKRRVPRLILLATAASFEPDPLSVNAPPMQADVGASWYSPATEPGTSGLRSEERRVGKECRSRWARNHIEKKNRVQKESVRTHT